MLAVALGHSGILWRFWLTVIWKGRFQSAHSPVPLGKRCFGHVALAMLHRTRCVETCRFGERFRQAVSLMSHRRYRGGRVALGDQSLNCRLAMAHGIVQVLLWIILRPAAG